MLINKAYKIEIKPNKEQVVLINKACGVARFAYNWGLNRRIELYKTEKKSTTAINQHKELNALKSTEYPWMYEVSKCAPQEALRDLDKAFGNFFRGCKTKQDIGFPKFKKKHGKSSYRLNGTIKVLENKIQLPKLGLVKLTETPDVTGKILSVTVSKDVDRFFVSINVEQEITVTPNLNGEIVGVDLGLKDLAILSDGSKLEHPKTLKKYSEKIKQANRALSRKQKGSRNRNKARIKLAKVYLKVKNIRKDYLHKFTTFLAKTKQEIVVEKLRIKNLVKNHKLAGAIHDSGWSEIVRQLEYKTGWYGSTLTKVDTFYPSSKLCSNCGFKNLNLTLKDRSWVCPNCNTVHGRDVNAALNLRSQAISLVKSVPGVPRDVKPVESPLSGELLCSFVPRHDSVKQELLSRHDSDIFVYKT